MDGAIVSTSTFLANAMAVSAASAIFQSMVSKGNFLENSSYFFGESSFTDLGLFILTGHTSILGETLTAWLTVGLTVYKVREASCDSEKGTMAGEGWCKW